VKALQAVTATSEQLLVLDDHRPGTLVIRGAAGTGKTTTALLRLKFLVGFWERRARDGYVTPPIRVLVLTYNRTLRGYVEALAREQVDTAIAELEIRTFAKWSTLLVGTDKLIEDEARVKLKQLASPMPLPVPFVTEEVEYVLGRFMPEDIDRYLAVERVGRGASPRMDRDLRMRLLHEVIYPYSEWKREAGFRDWNDLAMEAAELDPVDAYHIVVVDEAQDFSANQARAVLKHLAHEHSLTWVLDAAQRIYPRFFRWNEVGLIEPYRGITETRFR